MTEAEVVKRVNDETLRVMVAMVHHVRLDNTGLLKLYDKNGKELAAKLCEDLKGVASVKRPWEITSAISIGPIIRDKEPDITVEKG